MKIEIKVTDERKLLGKTMRMSYSDDKTKELWQSFMPLRNQITNRISDEFISMQVFPKDMKLGDLYQEYEKWAVVEVNDFEDIPEGMQTFRLEAGLYAVFFYKGLSSDKSVFYYIFTDWLPKSEYELDNRPLFEILGDKYKNNDPESEEEIWIPVRLKV